MDLFALDFLLRAGGAFVLLFVAVLAWRDSNGASVGRLFVPLSLCLSAFLVNNSDGPSILSGTAERIADLLAGWTVPFLWWFCLATFDRSFRVRGVFLALGLGWMILSTIDIGWTDSDLAERMAPHLSLVIGVMIVAHIVWRILRDRSEDMVDTRRSARPIVAALLVAQLSLDLVIDIVHGTDWRPSWFAVAQNAGIVLFACWFGWFALRSNLATRLYGAPTARGADRPKQLFADPRVAARVAALVEQERIFLDPDLSFADFVSRAGSTQRAVRSHINAELGFDHFRAFLNAHRIREACRMLESPATATNKIIAIAHDCGFASLASFNRAFRAATGVTPREYRLGNRGQPSFGDRIATF